MIDFLFSPGRQENVWLIIFLTGVVTYFTRSVGYVVLTRFSRLHPRVEAGLEAVPGAVLIALILPPALENGLLEVSAMIIALIASFRVSSIWILIIGMVMIIGGRALGF